MVLHSPIPSNETARVSALHSYRILDTEPEERFDLFTRLGTWLFQVPVCAINLVDEERTFFKSLLGFKSYEPRRCTSICAHAVGAGEAIMQVEDLSRDERFHDHPLFLQKGLRFYAGALLLSESGHAIGTLCIGDERPRVLSADERMKLLELSKGVAAVLELHRCGIRLLDAATRDTLTGIGNRLAFEDELQRATNQSKSGSSCALMYLDLDRFKLINDTMGHSAGDTVLCEVARRLAACARHGDVVARLAGDEFVLLMSGPVDTTAAERFAAHVLDALSAPFELQGHIVPIQCSVGIALCPEHASFPNSLLHCADLALYEAKRNGGHCFRFHRVEAVNPTTVLYQVSERVSLSEHPKSASI